LKTFGKLSEGNRGVKHVITEEELLKADPEIRLRCQELEEKEGLVLGPMVESDIPLMLELNGVKFDDEYGRFIIKRSRCFRNRKGEMVAWAGTHGDCKSIPMPLCPFANIPFIPPNSLTWYFLFTIIVLVSIAALHVLPEYRKTGLGRLVLHSLAMLHIKLAREILSTLGDDAEPVSATTLVAHADCMDYNQATMIFMERCGWHRIGFYLWIGVDKNSKE
jgi:GNAT superfamily N-acetyltransferase